MKIISAFHLKPGSFKKTAARLPHWFKKEFCFLALIIFLIMPEAKTQTTISTWHHKPIIYINLMLPSADSLLLVDGTGAMYGYRFSPNVDEYDAGKLSNFNENICLMRNGQQLAIEARPVPLKTDTLFIHMWGMKHQTYSLQIIPQNIPFLLLAKGWLIDNYLHTRVPVNLNNTALYTFNSTADTDSYMNRFMLVFARDTKPININTATIKQTVTVYPNPVAGNRITLQFINMIKDDYNVKLTGLSGNLITSCNIAHIGGSNEYSLPFSSICAKGIYTILISSKNNQNIIHLPVVIN